MVFGFHQSYTENLQTGNRIELTEVDVEACAEPMRLVAQTVRPKCEIFDCGDFELSSGEIDVVVEIGDPSEGQTRAEEGRRAADAHAG